VVKEHKSEKQQILSSLIWKFLERIGSKGINFIVQMVLARLLFPSEYGIVALVLVFTDIASVFVQSGVGTSLIQKKDLDEVDISSVFYLSLSIAILLYTLFYFGAPAISRFYDNVALVKVTRVLAFSLILGSFNTVQTALLSKNMQFKALFLSNLVAASISGVIGISLAFMNFGVWALVLQQIIRQVTISIILFIVVKWRPKFLFSFNKVKILYSFGWKLMVSSLIEQLYANLRALVVGKKYSPETLAYYNRGSTFPGFLISNVSGSIQSVLFPALAVHQDSLERIKNMTRRSIVTTSFLVFPMMVGLMVVAEPLVLLLLTNKWAPVIPFIQILAFSHALSPINTANLQALNAIGRSDIYLKLQIIKRSCGLVILVISLFFGIWGIVIGEVIAQYIALFVNIFPNRKILKYGYRQQAKDILPSFLLAFAMGAVVYPISFLGLSNLITMSIQVIVGVIFYFGAAYLLKMERFSYLLEAIIPFYGKRKK